MGEILTAPLTTCIANYDQTASLSGMVTVYSLLELINAPFNRTVTDSLRTSVLQKIWLPTPIPKFA